MKKNIPSRLQARIRLFRIYLELGYIPWRKRATRRERKQKDGVYMGARETIPFLNEDSRRTIAQLIFRPGYLMRDYIFRGQHERYLAPLTALIVFYTVFSLALAVLNPDVFKKSVGDDLYRGLRESLTRQADSTRVDNVDHGITIHFNEDVEDEEDDGVAINGPRVTGMLQVLSDALVLTRLDLHPEAANTHWKQSLAALEGDLRSKGIPLFLNNFLFLWLAMAVLLRKYRVSFSGAAAASAYVLCQYCVFMFLALLVTWGGSVKLGLLLTALLLFVDYRQMLGLGNKHALRLTVRTGVLMVVFEGLFYLLLGTGVVLFALVRTGGMSWA